MSSLQRKLTRWVAPALALAACGPHDRAEVVGEGPAPLDLKAPGAPARFRFGVTTGEGRPELAVHFVARNVSVAAVLPTVDSGEGALELSDYRAFASSDGTVKAWAHWALSDRQLVAHCALGGPDGASYRGGPCSFEAQVSFDAPPGDARPAPDAPVVVETWSLEVSAPEGGPREGAAPTLTPLF